MKPSPSSRAPGWRTSCAPLALACLTAGASALGCERVIGAEFGEAQRMTECELARPPEPPAGTDRSSTGEPMVFVVSSLDLGDTPDASGELRLERMGYDLDGSCTRPWEPPTCLPPRWTGWVPVDGAQGQDNGLVRLLYSNFSVAGTDAFTSPKLNQAVKNGAAAPNAVFRVSGYQGLTSDPAVEVEVFTGVALDRVDPLSEGLRFDGTDVVPLLRDSVDDPTPPYTSRYRSTSAFVTSFTLVAHFDRIRLSLTNVLVDVESAVLTAHMEARQGEHPPFGMTDGMVAGTVALQSVLGTLAETATEVFDTPFCTDDPEYPLVKPRACGAADLVLTSLPTDLGPGVCNALGFGYRFETAPAVLGELADDPRQNPCSDETDPGRDTCSER